MTTKKETATVHELIPKHEKLSDQEKQKLLSEMNINFKDLPKIFKNDPAIASTEVKAGDIIKITRKSATAKETTFFRGVIDA
jgi:DNA-directed RNA polymerase subunit H